MSEWKYKFILRNKDGSVISRKRFFVLFLYAFIAFAVLGFILYKKVSTPVSEKILNAKYLSDLGSYPEVNVFPELLNEIRKKPENAENFEALFHYHSIKDGGAASYMQRESFHFFFSEKPLILYNRYIQTGDERILHFCKDILEVYDPAAFSEEGDSLIKKQKIIADLILKLRKDEGSVRGKIFLQNMINIR